MEFLIISCKILAETFGFATKGDGIILAEKEGAHFKFTRFKYDEDDIYSLSHNSVYWLHEDKHGRIWVATFGGGLNYIQKLLKGNMCLLVLEIT